MAGQLTRMLIDQIRSIDTDYLVGDPVDYLSREQMGEVEFALTRYLGLDQFSPGTIGERASTDTGRDRE